MPPFVAIVSVTIMCVVIILATIIDVTIIMNFVFTINKQVEDYYVR